MAFLKKLLTAPVFADKAKTHEAYLLHIIVWILILVPLLFLVYNLVFAPENLGRTFVQLAFGESINVILLILLRQGQVRVASIIQVSAFWLFFTATAATGTGVLGSAYTLGYGLVIVIAGILLGGQGALIFTILSLASGFIMALMQENGTFIATHLDLPLSSWFISLVLFPVSATLQYLASHTVQNTLAQANTNEERYRLISRVSSDYTFSTILDAENKMHLNWVAGAFTEITGYSYEEYVATGGWVGHIHPDDVGKDAHDMVALHTNQKVVTEVRTYCQDKSIKWVRVYAHPIWDEKQNRLVGIVGAVRDITARKQAEAELAFERDLLQQFMDNIPDTVYFKDTASRFIRINKAQARLLRLHDPQEAYGKTDLDFQSPTLAQGFLAEEQQLVASGEAIINRIEFNPTPDGQPRWFSATKVPVKDGSGRVTGIIGVSRDVTDEKRVEEGEQRRRLMLEKVINLGKQVTEVNNLRTTLEKIWQGVHDDLGFDRLAIFLYNPERNSMDDTFGTDKQGNRVDHWHIWYPVDEWSTFKQMLEKPDGLFFTHQFDIDNQIPEGHEMYGVKDYAAVAAWAGNKPVAVICVDHLLTRRPIAEEQLEALRLFAGYVGLAIENARLKDALERELTQRQTLIEELGAKNSELEQFTYTVSHDLKSPLVTITGFLGFLEKDIRSGNLEKVLKTIERIAQAVQKMQALLNDLLKLSRIGRLINPPEAVSFYEIVREAVEMVRGQLDRHKIQVVVHNDLPLVYGDRARLIEVVQNLLDNATKYSRPGMNSWVEVGVVAKKERDKFVLFVRDNGIGIEPQFYERIFGLFDKLDAQSEGTGVGLAVVKRIVEIHGGRIWVESLPGEGSTFYFTLPGAPSGE